ncbi:MAG: aminotransferase class I/II-fold pyridoxal phosphate-dependent enzyme, partial [Clostridia bacterium]|nr:aminotransferase class I/II-fold pyridoxal phosphate-dependent enzyme [Clostridia bacterium]
NLSSPTGCIQTAQKEIAEILGAAASFLSTDGSTGGIFAILYAAKTLGVKRIAMPETSHKSLYNGCAALGLDAVTFAVERKNGIPAPVSLTVLSAAVDEADALFLTSPDYYGNIPDLKGIAELCKERGKLFFIDGAHGGHLHFDREKYAGAYADLWVDGVHKSLPAYTQGAIVSARTKELAAKLSEGLDIFRTTSPSYPIMASVEFAARFPRNEKLEKQVWEFTEQYPEFFYCGGDWTKLCFLAGRQAFDIAKELEKKGIYAEFCDGNVVMFYLSPALKSAQFKKLKKALIAYMDALKLMWTAGENAANASDVKDGQKTVRQSPAPVVFDKNGGVEWVELSQSEGRVCAKVCGLFPPCMPLILDGEAITEKKIKLMLRADHLFGIEDGKICVYKK